VRADVAALAAQAPHSPAFRIRVLMPGERLPAHGVRVRPLPLFTSDEGRRFAAGGIPSRARIALGARRRLRAQVASLDGTADTVLFQRQADMLPTVALERAAAAGRRVVLDIDDAIWHDGPAAGGHPLARLKGSRRKVDWIASRADVVIAGNELLADFLSTRSRDVRVIPSLVDVERVPVRVHEDAGEVVAGWIGSQTTVGFLDAMRPALERMASAVAPCTLELLVVGGEIAPVRGVRTTVVRWSEAAEREALERMDVGLMPLDDTPFTRGKCAYKALQYMASGIPVVADDVGISAEVIGDGRGGLIARSHDEWAQAVAQLAGDAALRAQLGAEGRRRVASGFSYERWIPELARALGGG
jgi:glycosyltransferase involved in cell wall biosynthesis